MNTLANVLYTYIPKNDDELELKVGDKIEVIGFEEEGWWKGRLKGKIGVFPSNFVQVVETTGSSTAPQPITNLPATVTANNTNNKLSLFGKTSKTSLSTNSLNSNNSNSNINISNNSSSNNNNNNNNNNLTMNNTQQQENSGLTCNEEASITSSEMRPKPVRGLGFGDNFAAGIKLKPLPTDHTNERLNTASLAATLQKQIPKKPPPPAPITLDSSNGNSTATTNNASTISSSTDRAPALPPKPSNQFSPHLQPIRPLPPAQQLPPPSLPHHHQQQQQQQHQATHQQVREQAEVIYAYEPKNDDELELKAGDIINIIDKNIEDQGWWRGELHGKSGVFPDNFVRLIEIPETPITTGQDWHQRVSAAATPPIQPTTPNFSQISENRDRIKSVFAATPKGFSKELENNLEKNNSPASFLSLKRNKLAQQQSASSSAGTTIDGQSYLNESMNGSKRDDVIGSMETNISKLNHITANRAKGPSRRPPSNVLSKRNQLDLSRKESNGRDDVTLGSLPINPVSSNSHPSTIHDSLSSLPAGQNTSIPSPAPATTPNSISTATNNNTGLTSGPNQQVKSTDQASLFIPIKSSLSMDNVLDNIQLPVTPKTSQRMTQATPTLEKSKSVAEPPWMLELKKATAERKKDTPTLASISNPTQYDILLKQISKDITSEMSELRDEVKRLREEVQDINELKNTLEVMKIELKTCQSATENQKRYIKELVNNLSDERKKIAAMQIEIDRTLK